MSVPAEPVTVRFDKLFDGSEMSSVPEPERVMVAEVDGEANPAEQRSLRIIRPAEMVAILLFPPAAVCSRFMSVVVAELLSIR